MKKILILLLFVFSLSGCIFDNEPPVITLNGEKEITIEVGKETYNELGAKVTDNIDENIQVQIEGEVDSDRLGKYTLKYTSTDKAGNQAETLERIVKVVDTSKPKISCYVDNYTCATFFSEYTLFSGYNEPNWYEFMDVYIEDQYDGMIEYRRSMIKENVDMDKPGNYEITISVSDKSGNTESYKFEVVITNPFISALKIFKETKNIGFDTFKGLYYKKYFGLPSYNQYGSAVDYPYEIENSSRSYDGENYIYNLNFEATGYYRDLPITVNGSEPNANLFGHWLIDLTEDDLNSDFTNNGSYLLLSSNHYDEYAKIIFGEYSDISISNLKIFLYDGKIDKIEYEYIFDSKSGEIDLNFDY